MPIKGLHDVSKRGWCDVRTRMTKTKLVLSQTATESVRSETEQVAVDVVRMSASRSGWDCAVRMTSTTTTTTMTPSALGQRQWGITDETAGCLLTLTTVDRRPCRLPTTPVQRASRSRLLQRQTTPSSRQRVRRRSVDDTSPAAKHALVTFCPTQDNVLRQTWRASVDWRCRSQRPIGLRYTNDVDNSLHSINTSTLCPRKAREFWAQFYLGLSK